jgi:hypothetical protein
MNSSIALGDAVEMIIELTWCHRPVRSLGFISAGLGAEIIFLTLLYGANVYHNMSRHGESDDLLIYASVLALCSLFAALSVEISFSRVEEEIWKLKFELKAKEASAGKSEPVTGGGHQIAG